MILEMEASVSVFDKLRYRNQFVLGPHFIEKLVSWNCTHLTGSIVLSSHPELNVHRNIYRNKSLTLIGCMLDPYDPAANDSDILSEMMQNFESFDSLFKYTHRLGGRWIVVAKNGNEIRLFNDPAGLRQVFYSDVGLTGELWCASQPGMIADILSLDMSVEGIDYINSYEFQNNPEYHWPGTSTPFKEIIHLLPNHFLHLSTGMCERFWPNCFFQEMSLDTAIQKCSALFQGVIRSASNRFELALGVTAGLDCRVVLAASKGIKNIFSYMTVRQIGMRNDHADVMIPSVMLAQNDLRHDLVESSLVIDKEHFKIFQGNTAVPHSVYASDTYAINDYYAKKYGKRFVVLTGSAAEIGRCSHRSDLKKPLGERIYAEDLASLERMGKSRYVLDSFDKWLRGAENIYNYDVLDLHEWEQGHGNWLAMCQLEFDIAWKDLITPYNCRELLETMLSVDKKYRKAPDYLLYKAIIYNLWPELLNVPVNPHKDYAISRRKKSAGIRKYMGIIPSPIKKSLKNIQRLFL